MSYNFTLCDEWCSFSSEKFLWGELTVENFKRKISIGECCCQGILHLSKYGVFTFTSKLFKVSENKALVFSKRKGKSSLLIVTTCIDESLGDSYESLDTCFCYCD